LVNGKNMPKEKRSLCYRKEELDEIRNLYESIMSVASHGLFFRSGKILGRRFVERSYGGEKYSNMLVEEGWASEVIFNGGDVCVTESIEVIPGKGECTCHMLRGVLSRIIEEREKKPCLVKETMCVSKGDVVCKFHYGGD